MGYRLRGQEQIVRAIEDVKRAARLGCRGFLVYDEGCLWVLNEMRKAGEIPADCHFKVSAHTGHGNPCSAKLLESIGADSYKSCFATSSSKCWLLCVRRWTAQLTFIPKIRKSTGGFIRHYEVPEMIRIAAPIYLKTGGSVAATHSWNSTEDDARKRAKQCSLVKRMIDEYYPEAVWSPRGSLL